MCGYMSVPLTYLYTWNRSRKLVVEVVIHGGGDEYNVRLYGWRVTPRLHNQRAASDARVTDGLSRRNVKRRLRPDVM